MALSNQFCKSAVLFLTCFTLGYSYETTAERVDYYENIEHLSQEKYTENQFNKIIDGLEKKDEKIRYMSFNMLFDLYDHNLDPENRWPERLPRIAELVKRVNPDVIGTQELFGHQITETADVLKENYNMVEGYGKPAGESYAVFYKKDRFEVLDQKSQDPVTIVKLKDLKTEKIFTVFNTHLAFGKKEKREKQARVIADLIKAEDGPVVFSGDLNTFTNWMDFEGFPFYDGEYIHSILREGGIEDSQTNPLLGHFGPISTFTNDGESIAPFKGEGTPGVVLDYIYVTPSIEVLAHATENGRIEGHFPSDHMPVFCDLLIKD